jgi:hypothetical protein
MSVKVTERGLKRRHFLSSALALSGITAAASVLGPCPAWGAGSHQPLDPINPDILFGSTSSLWTPQHDIVWAVNRISALGLQGIEPYPNAIENYRNNPLALKKIFDDAGVTFIDCSNGGRSQSTNFIDPDQIPKTIADHVAFARDFLQPLGCDHWKVNMGRRPPGGPSDEQLQRLADTLNEIGRQTLAMGIRLAPHPHIWGPMEREKEMRRVMDLTDPRYVWMTPDTADRRSPSEGHLRQISRQYLHAERGGTQQSGERLSQSGRWRRRFPGCVQAAARPALQRLGGFRPRRPEKG